MTKAAVVQFDSRHKMDNPAGPFVTVEAIIIEHDFRKAATNVARVLSEKEELDHQRIRAAIPLGHFSLDPNGHLFYVEGEGSRYEDKSGFEQHDILCPAAPLAAEDGKEPTSPRCKAISLHPHVHTKIDVAPHVVCSSLSDKPSWDDGMRLLQKHTHGFSEKAQGFNPEQRIWIEELFATHLERVRQREAKPLPEKIRVPSRHIGPKRPADWGQMHAAMSEHTPQHS